MTFPPVHVVKRKWEEASSLISLLIMELIPAGRPALSQLRLDKEMFCLLVSALITLNKCPFHNWFIGTFLCSLSVISLFKMACKCSAEVLSSVPKSTKNLSSGSHSNFIHNSLKMETTYFAIKMWVKNKLCHTHAMQYYPAINMLSMHTITGINL